jgi:hypothetical protein
MNKQQLLAMLMSQQPNITTGSANPALRTSAPAPPTPQSVDRRRMLAEILSVPVETPRTPAGMVPSIEGAAISGVANIAKAIMGARNRKKSDAQSRELLAKELAISQGQDPFASELQPIESPVLSGRVPILEGPGADEAVAATQAGIQPFQGATEATRAAEQPARAEHDLAALLDPRASGMAAQRIAPPPGDPFTLGAGQSRFDAQGNVIAQSPHAPGTGNDAKPPASIAEYNLYSEQTRAAGEEPASFQDWQQSMARGQVIEFEGAKYILNPVTKEYTPISTREGEISAAADRASQISAAEEGGVSLTPGQRAVDTKFADDYVQWQAVGGFADVQKNLSQLQDVQRRLESGEESLTGTAIGNTPRNILAATNPAALNTLEAVEEVVQRNLRLILGAQFTEKEGERLIARAYNPRLPESDNAVRVGRLMRSLEDAAKAKDSAAQYFAERGTLAGWNGRLFTLGDFESAISSSSNETEPSQTREAQEITDDPLSSLTPEQRQRYGL